MRQKREASYFMYNLQKMMAAAFNDSYLSADVDVFTPKDENGDWLDGIVEIRLSMTLRDVEDEEV